MYELVLSDWTVTQDEIEASWRLGGWEVLLGDLGETNNAYSRIHFCRASLRRAAWNCPPKELNYSLRPLPGQKLTS
jgi:hypothetical protein